MRIIIIVKVENIITTKPRRKIAASSILVLVGSLDREMIRAGIAMSIKSVTTFVNPRQ
jgi:hypothetical protein